MVPSTTTLQEDSSSSKKWGFLPSARHGSEHGTNVESWNPEVGQLFLAHFTGEETKALGDFFFLLAVLEFELRASHLLARHNA
jgi:hypothetical protein